MRFYCTSMAQALGEDLLPARGDQMQLVISPVSSKEAKPQRLEPIETCSRCLLFAPCSMLEGTPPVHRTRRSRKLAGHDARSPLSTSSVSSAESQMKQARSRLMSHPRVPLRVH